jgi:RND superfamily putative drug exporter
VPLYLLGTVVLNYLASMGIGVLIFQYWLGQQIAWLVPLLAFIILVAVGPITTCCWSRDSVRSPPAMFGSACCAPSPPPAR